MVPEWMLDAPCSLRPDLDWFDLGCGLQAATTVCYGCPVQNRCLDYAVQHAITEGVWGGLWGDQLVQLITRRRRG